MKKILPIIIGLIILTTSCDSDDLDLNTNYPNELINTWVESYEENYGTYRPIDYTTFPESNFRQYYNFTENNKCEYLVLSPVDAHYMENGFWEYIESESIVNMYDSNKNLNRKLKVISISSDLFQIEP